MIRPPCSLTMPWLIESPRPVPSPFRLGGEERLEHLGRERLGHAGSVVDHVDRHAVEPAAGAHHDRAGPAGRGDGLRRVVDEIDEDLLDLVRVDVRHRQVGLDLERGLHPLRHELVAEQQERGVEQGLQRRGPPLVLLLAREAEQVLHDVRGPLGLLLDDRQRLAERRAERGGPRSDSPRIPRPTRAGC